MAQVVVTSTLARQFTAGQTRLEIVTDNVRDLLRILEQRFPGLGVEIERAQGLAIDGEFIQDPLAEPLHEQAEVFVLPKIAGG